MDITRWVNPQAPGYTDTRPSSNLNETSPVPYEFALEGILFKGMPYPDDATGAGTTPEFPDGLNAALNAGGGPAAQVFDGILRLGLEFHLGTTTPDSHTADNANLEKGDKALGGAGDWVTLTCAPSDAIKMRNGTPVPDTGADRLAFGDAGADAADIATGYNNRAEGYGKHALGGRYGHVFTVTKNTDDANDPGTLRHAIQSPVPRTIIFALPEGTDGIIALASALTLKDPYCTIAGQTAFRNGGAGVCLKNFGLRIRGDDVIVRHLRSRPGNETQTEAAGNIDSFSIEGVATRVILDHCTASFSSDCLMDVATGKDDGGAYYLRPNRRITLQNNLLAWPQDRNNHIEGGKLNDHGYATLIRAGKGAGVTVWRNLFAHCRSRIPRPGGMQTINNDPESLKLDFINNAVYGWGDKGTDSIYASAGYDGNAGTGVYPTGGYNMVGNHYLQRLNLPGKTKYWFLPGNPQIGAFISGNLNGVAGSLGTWIIPGDQYASPPIQYDALSDRNTLGAGISGLFPTWNNNGHIRKLPASKKTWRGGVKMDRKGRGHFYFFRQPRAL